MADNMVDMSSLRRFADDLALVGRELSIAIPTTHALEAKALAQKAKDIASSYVSSGNNPSTGAADAVASTIRPRRETRRVWKIEAGGGIPLAGLWELGNKGTNPNDPTFRHPAWGRSDWYPQDKWPYLRMAVEQYEPTILTSFDTLVNRVFRRHRL